MIELLVPVRVVCDTPTCKASAMGTASCRIADSGNVCSSVPVIMVPTTEPTMPPGWTLDMFLTHRCPSCSESHR